MIDSTERLLRAADPLPDQQRDQATSDAAWLGDQAEVAMSHPRVSGDPVRTRPGRAILAAAAAAVIAVGALTATRALMADTPTEPTAVPMALALGPDTPTMTSCVPFSVETLSGMPVAFSGTVVDASDARVLLDVDRWYRGGDAEQVSLTAGAAAPTSIDPLVFEEGERYLLTATAGMLNYCGFSASWSQRGADDFDVAFG